MIMECDGNGLGPRVLLFNLQFYFGREALGVICLFLFSLVEHR